MFFFLVASCTPPAPLLSVGADVSNVIEAGDVRLSVKGALGASRLRWTQISPREPQGVFSDPTIAAPTWSAPVVCADTDFILSVRVIGDDEQGLELTVTVNDSTQAQAPTITASKDEVVAGEEFTLRLTTLGPGCGAASVQWADPVTGGTFTAPKAAVTRWYSGVIGASSEASLTATADGLTRAATVSVRVPTFADVNSVFERADCFGCHAPGGRRPGGFDMTMLSVTSTAGRSDCGSGRLFVPGDENASIFVKRLRRNGCSSGTRMPWDNTVYFDDHPGELIEIESWVRAGATF